MLKQLIFSFVIVNSCFLSAQDKDLVSRHRPGFLWYDNGMRPAIPEKARKYDRLVFDICYNDWYSNQQKAFKVSPASIGFNVNFMAIKPISKGNTLTFAYGFSYGFYKLNLHEFLIRNEQNQTTTLGANIENYGIEKSVFKAHNLAIPLEIRFRGKNWKHAKLHIGGKLMYYYRPSTTLVSFNNKIENHQKSFGFYDFNHFNLSAYTRIGIRNYSLFACYNFMPFFKNRQSLQVYPFQLGISISLF